MYSPLRIIQSNIIALKFIHALLTYPSLTEPLTTTDLFNASIVLPFPEYHIIVIIQYIAFSNWFFSFSNMHFRFLHVFTWFSRLFFYSAEKYSIVWMHQSLFIHSRTEGPLGYFQFWQLCISFCKHSCTGFCVDKLLTSLGRYQ